MLSLQRVPDSSSIENVGVKCLLFEPVANVEGRSFCKRLNGTVCCCVANALRDSSGDDKNESFFERHFSSFKGKLAWRTSNRNAVITSRHSFGNSVDGVITKDNVFQDTETDFDHLEQLFAGDGCVQLLKSPRLQGIIGRKLLQEPKHKSKSRIKGKILLQELPNPNKIEHTRRDLACETGNGAFTMEDGESYTSFSVGKDELPIVCNSKGCRPVSESERQSPVYISRVLRSSNKREIDSLVHRKMKPKGTHLQDSFPRIAQNRSERDNLGRDGYGDKEATTDSLNCDSETPPDDSVLASYAWLLWNEVDDL